MLRNKGKVKDGGLALRAGNQRRLNNSHPRSELQVPQPTALTPAQNKRTLPFLSALTAPLPTKAGPRKPWQNPQATRISGWEALQLQLLACVPHSAREGPYDHRVVVWLRHRVQQLKVKVAQQHGPNGLDLQGVRGGEGGDGLRCELKGSGRSLGSAYDLRDRQLHGETWSSAGTLARDHLLHAVVRACRCR